ncbi:MAG: sulfatase-like hydrolase/transferase [bacterium]|nr:sulfatase-like hydrolase/transferase [Candidatus Minthenecus merdequi]
MLQALFNIFVILALYTISRLFFYFTNLEMFTDITFAHLMEILGGGMRFDLTAVLYCSSLYLAMSLLPFPVKWRTNKIYACVQKYAFFVPNALGLLINSADMVYIRFSDRRTTCSFFSEFANESNLFGIFVDSAVEYWYVTLFAIAIVVGLFFLYRPYKPFLNLKPSYYYILTSVLFVVSGYFTVIGIRGGFGAFTRPINMSNAMTYVDKPAETSLVLNTPFCLMRTIDNETYENPHFFADDQLESVMSPVHPAPCKPIFSEKPNVVIFILESFAAEHIGFYNPVSKPFTPFLDSLMSRSITFRHAYSGGRKSIDAPPAILSSIPKLYESFVFSSYSTNKISSVADVLNNRGYHTSFFHGAPNGSMGFEAFVHNGKFQHYFGMNEFLNDPQSDKDTYDGNWGIWDDDFITYFERSIGKLPQPFLTSIFTLTSHSPFNIPEKYKGKVPEGKVPINHCIAYTDIALRHFFDAASNEPWFYNTIFVLVADHSSVPVLPEYTTDEGLFRIPLVFYIPALADNKCDEAMFANINDSSETKRIEYISNYPRCDSTSVVSQLDIFPSIMSILGYDKPFFAFGQDIITQPKQHNYAVTFQYPYFQVISGNGYIQFDGKNVVSVNGKIPADEKADMIRYLKAYIQQYVVHLLNNTLY